MRCEKSATPTSTGRKPSKCPLANGLYLKRPRIVAVERELQQVVVQIDGPEITRRIRGTNFNVVDHAIVTQQDKVQLFLVRHVLVEHRQCPCPVNCILPDQPSSIDDDLLRRSCYAQNDPRHRLSLAFENFETIRWFHDLSILRDEPASNARLCRTGLIGRVPRATLHFARVPMPNSRLITIANPMAWIWR